MRSLRFGLFLFLICLVFAGSASASLDSLIGNFGDSGDKKTKPNQNTTKSSATSSNGSSDIMSDMSAKVIQKEEEKRKKEEEAAVREYLNEIEIQTRRYLESIAGPKPIIKTFLLHEVKNTETHEEYIEEQERIRRNAEADRRSTADKRKEIAVWQRKLPEVSEVKKHISTLRPHDQLFQEAVEKFFAPGESGGDSIYYDKCVDEEIRF